jgi:uncharacterized paraquat-inducible protein A
MKKCHSCSETLDEGTALCPNCGARTAFRVPSGVTTLVGCVVGAILIVVVSAAAVYAGCALMTAPWR